MRSIPHSVGASGPDNHSVEGGDFIPGVLERFEMRSRDGCCFGRNTDWHLCQCTSDYSYRRRMNFHPSMQHKNQLAELWERSWGSMQGHVTAPQEIHRKVLRMVSPLTEQDAKLMLRQMGQRPTHGG